MRAFVETVVGIIVLSAAVAAIHYPETSESEDDEQPDDRGTTVITRSGLGSGVDWGPAMAKSNIVKADVSTLDGWKNAHATHKSGPFFETRVGEHEWWKCPCGAKWPTTRSGI